MYYDRKRYTLYHDGLAVEVEEPSNWNEDEKTFSRHKDYHGISVNLSDSISFFGEGKAFLQSIVDTYGLNTDVQLVVNKKDEQTDIWEIDYVGWIDLLTMKISETAFEVKFNADPYIERFKAKGASKIELATTTSLEGDDIGTLDTVNMNIEGRNILLTSSLAMTEDVYMGMYFQDQLVARQKEPAKLKELNENLNYGPELVQSVLRTDYGQTRFTDPGNAGNTIIGRNDLGFDVTYDILIDVKNSVHTSVQRAPKDFVYTLTLVFYENDTAYDIKDEIDLYTYTGTVDDMPSNINASYSEKHTFKAGESAGLFWTIFSTDNDTFFSIGTGYHSDPDAGDGGIFDPNPSKLVYYNKNTGRVEDAYSICNVTVTEESQRVPTYSKGILAFEYAKRINDIILGTKFVSNLLAREDVLGYEETGLLGETAFVHGMWLRGLDSTSDTFKPLSTSFKDFYKSIDTLTPIGISIDKGVTRIEHRDYFYQKYTSINVGEVEDFEILPNGESYVTSIDVGYKKAGGHEEDQGLDEYNRETQYNTAITKTDNIMDLVSPYRADGYGLETIRRKNPQIDNDADVTKDDRFDDEIWGLDVKYNSGTGYWVLKRWEERFEKAPVNVYSPNTVINLWFSPINILLRHGSWIKPPLLKELDTMIAFNSSEGNSDIKTQLKGGIEYQQNIGVPVSDFERSAHKAMIATFRAPVTYDELNGTTNGKPNIYGLCEFSKWGVRYKGYIMEVKLLNGIGEFQVLLATSITSTSTYVEPEVIPMQTPTGINVIEL